MKKILSIGLISISLISNLFADNRGGIDISVGSFQFDSVKSGSGLSVGMDVKGETNLFGSDLYVGVGINGEIFDPGNIEGMDSDLGIILDIYPSLSYDLIDGISINSMFGYSIGQIGSEYFDGTTYGFGLDYKLTKKLNFGLKYKESSLTFTKGNIDIDAERINGYLTFKF